MNELDTVRLIGEVVGILLVLFAFTRYLAGKIWHAITLLEELQSTVGNENNPRRNTILGRLNHQDACTDSVRAELRVMREVEATARLAVSQRLARIEGRLGLASIDEEMP